MLSPHLQNLPSERSIIGYFYRTIVSRARNCSDMYFPHNPLLPARMAKIPYCRFHFKYPISRCKAPDYKKPTIFFLPFGCGLWSSFHDFSWGARLGKNSILKFFQNIVIKLNLGWFESEYTNFYGWINMTEPRPRVYLGDQFKRQQIVLKIAHQGVPVIPLIIGPPTKPTSHRRLFLGKPAYSSG